LRAHPIYTALLLGGAGVVLLGGRASRVWAWLGLLALLWAKTLLEEKALAVRCPDYRAYAARTPRLLPNPVRCVARIRAARSHPAEQR
jgi:protein-S-isoprenylcysteine O-methyltransferase Ste14